jgi:outer membrane receptor protein involved in Fe transport
LTYAHATFTNGDAIPLAPTLLMNGGLTLERGGFSTALRVRFLDDRPATPDRSLTARGYTLLDLLARYRWRNVEVSLALLNLTDTDWREAQFADQTCVRREVKIGGSFQAGDPCDARPGQQTQHFRTLPDGRRVAVEPPADIHFTPGNPFGVRAGLTIYF